LIGEPQLCRAAVSGEHVAHNEAPAGMGRCPEIQAVPRQAGQSALVLCSSRRVAGLMHVALVRGGNATLYRYFPTREALSAA
jgi:hypothetical protein